MLSEIIIHIKLESSANLFYIFYLKKMYLEGRHLLATENYKMVVWVNFEKKKILIKFKPSLSK